MLIDTLSVIENQVDAILLPEKIFVWLGIIERKVTHVDIHECRAGEEVWRFRRDNDNLTITEFPDMSRRRNARDAVADDHHLFHADCLVTKL